MTQAQREILWAAIARVDAQHPGLRQRDLDGWLGRVVWLAHTGDSAFGRKRNPSGRISPDTLAVWLGADTAPPPYFQAISIARDNLPTNELRLSWLIYDPGPISDGSHVGPDQEFIQAREYTDVSWETARVPPAPPPPGTVDSPALPGATLDEVRALIRALGKHLGAWA